MVLHVYSASGTGYSKSAGTARRVPGSGGNGNLGRSAASVLCAHQCGKVERE